MLKLMIEPKPIAFYCSMFIDDALLTELNCATTGKSGGHIKYDEETEQKLLDEFQRKIAKATIQDFNFRHLTDPDDWNKIPKGDYRTANGAFFTLLYRYNQIAKREGKPTITTEDIVEFIKEAATKHSSLVVKGLTAKPGHPTGNDGIPVVEIKAPISQLLKGKDLGILGATTEERLQKIGPETDMYIKIAFQPTKSRDTKGNLSVIEEGIQPLSFHRDADSQNTSTDPDDSAVNKAKRKAWDTNYISKDISTRAPKEYFKSQEK